jgi:beta-ureidopropionase
LKQYLPKKVFDNIRQILYGTQTPEVPLRQETIQRASQIDVEVKQFRVNSEAEQIRSKRLVKVAAIQNKIVLETTKPIQEQKRAIMDRIKEIIEVAAL